jgi:putative transposase
MARSARRSNRWRARASLWLDATYLKVRQGGRIVSVAAIVAVAANTDGRREIIGLGLGPSEAETFWMDFLRGLKARGLDGTKLVISDAHSGLRAAIERVFEATWQRCRVHWMRNALAHVSRGQHTVVAAAIRQAFDQPDRKQAGETWRRVADQLRSRWPKLAELMDDSEHDVLAYMAFPRQHRTKLHSTNPIERLNKEVKRRADVVGIFPNEASITRLIGAVLFEQNDEWQTASRYMQVEAFARSRPSPRSTTRRWTPFSASLPKPPDHDLRPSAKLHHLDGRDPGRRGGRRRTVMVNDRWYYAQAMPDQPGGTV